MKTLFVEKKAMELRYERACLLIYHQGKRISSVPLNQLERIVVAPHVALAAGVLGLVAEKQVALVVVNTRYPDRTAVLSGTIKGDVHRRLAQYQLHQDTKVRLYWAIFIVKVKIFRQRQLLKNLRVRRPDLRLALTQAIDALTKLGLSFSSDECPQSLESLRGKEGAAGAIFFKAYKQVFSANLKFMGRNRRPPKDPVNVCLSLSYTICYHESVNAIKTVGLDSSLGCLHEPYYRRDSLACDLMEPLRPLVDKWVYQLFQQQIIRSEDFSMNESGCELHSAGKQRFYEEFRQKLPFFRRLLRRYARHTANIVCQYEQSQS
jgi:CRISP-associated protein Cas1